MLSKYPFDKHVSYFFFSENGKKGKRLIQRKGALIPFYPTTDCLSQNITFSHESHY